MIFYVYLTTNLITGKKYIGQRSYKGVFIDEDPYLGSGKLLKQAISKYGSKNFKKEILEVCPTKELLDEREKYYISKYDAVNSRDFYNLAEGGSGGNTYAGLSLEERARISALKSIQNSGKNNPNYGKHHSKETREKISLALKTKFLQEPLSHGTTGLIGELNSLSKTIYSPEYKKYFIGIRETARQLNIPSPNITRALKNHGKYSAGKLNGKRVHWFYADEWEEYKDEFFKNQSF